MPLKGNDMPADCPRNELDEEEEEETVKYSQVHHSGTANGLDGDDGEFGSVEENGDEDAGRPPTKRRRAPRQLFIYPRSITQESWKRREGVVRRSCISFIIQWRSYSDPLDQSCRSRVEVVLCDRYTKYYKSHGAVCLFPTTEVLEASRRWQCAVWLGYKCLTLSVCFPQLKSWRLHGVHSAPCDWGISVLHCLSICSRSWREYHASPGPRSSSLSTVLSVRRPSDSATCLSFRTSSCLTVRESDWVLYVTLFFLLEIRHPPTHPS